MLNLMKQETNKTLTENGAITNETSGSACLDLFATIGALRREDDEEIVSRFIRAYTEDAGLAMKLLFFCQRHTRRAGREACISYNFFMVS